MNTETILFGVFMKVIMSNLKTSYTVAEIKKEDGQIVHIAGTFIPVPIGTRIKASGIWTETKYGWQLIKAELSVVSNTTASMIEYLTNIKGVGTTLATAVANEVGEALFKAPDSAAVHRKLCSIRGLNDALATDIVETVKNTQTERELFEYLSKHGGSYTVTMKIVKKYGVDSFERLKHDPYSVGRDGGLSFAVCDQIAMEQNISIYADVRVIAGIKQSLRMAAQAGHTFLSRKQLFENARNLLNAPDKGWLESVGCVLIDTMLNTAATDLVADGDRLYSKIMYHFETGCASSIKRLLSSAKTSDTDPASLCAYAQAKIGVEYAPEQRQAFGLLNKGGVVIVTGGPGTGKTTVINGLLCAYENLYPNNKIALCAPTGRASQRMKEATGREAVTIHRLLDYRPFGDDVTYKDQTNPIEADLIVVDESSMLSIDIACILFNAVKSGTMVMLVGDTDQLPCVGAGNVLLDMIACGVIPTVQLKKTYRQAETSLIIKNAKTINSGFANLLQGEDFDVQIGREEDLPQMVLAAVAECDAENPFDVQVLTPARRKGESSSNALNKVLQAQENPTGVFMRYGDTIFRLGDKIMMIRNNYTVGYYNGDVGVIKYLTDDGLVVTIDGQDIDLTRDLLEDVTLAYATTIHKSQGSEYKTAIVVLPSEPVSMLQRNLLYTAVTRAKKKCVVIATSESIRKAVKRSDSALRNTYLKERICG